jgi:hypothetical protein
MSPDDIACELFIARADLDSSDKKLRAIAQRACAVADLFCEEITRFAINKSHKAQLERQAATSGPEIPREPDQPSQPQSPPE